MSVMPAPHPLEFRQRPIQLARELGDCLDQQQSVRLVGRGQHVELPLNLLEREPLAAD